MGNLALNPHYFSPGRGKNLKFLGNERKITTTIIIIIKKKHSSSCFQKAGITFLKLPCNLMDFKIKEYLQLRNFVGVFVTQN